jgi:hypothetical protein
MDVLGVFAPLRLCVNLLWLRLRPRRASEVNQAKENDYRGARSAATIVAKTACKKQETVVMSHGGQTKAGDRAFHGSGVESI